MEPYQNVIKTMEQMVDLHEVDVFVTNGALTAF